VTVCVTLLKDICDQLSRPVSKDFPRCKNAAAGLLTGSIADNMSTISSQKTLSNNISFLKKGVLMLIKNSRKTCILVYSKSTS